MTSDLERVGLSFKDSTHRHAFLLTKKFRSFLPFLGNRGGDIQQLSLVEKHSKWANLASIRNLNPTLSDCLRMLLTDLFERDSEAASLEASLAAVKKDASERENHQSQSLEKVYSFVILLCFSFANPKNSSKMNNTVSQLRSRLKAVELDLEASKAAKVILDRVRVALKAFPVDLTRDRESDLRTDGISTHRLKRIFANATDSRIF